MRYFLFLIVSLSFVFMAGSCKLENRIARAYKKYDPRVPYDVIIVPGYPYDTTPKLTVLASRMYWAKEIYERGMARNIIFSGGALSTPYVEAKIMKIIADSFGIPSKHTFTEEQARHSYQNVSYGYKKARKLGFKKIAFATDPTQFSYMKAILWMSAPGSGILTFSHDSMEKYARPLPPFNPQEAYVKDFIPPKKKK